jgi:hypothetical protein
MGTSTASVMLKNEIFHRIVCLVKASVIQLSVK